VEYHSVPIVRHTLNRIYTKYRLCVLEGTWDGCNMEGGPKKSGNQPLWMIRDTTYVEIEARSCDRSLYVVF
jgi:hypothetical protein